MGKRGSKPKGKVRLGWSSNFAYALGLIASDGSLSKDGRHIVLTSVDKDQLKNFLHCLRIRSSIRAYKGSDGKTASRVQIGDVLFYKFLQGIGLTPAKSKTIGPLQIPQEFFFDFLRGVFDGDGSTYSYWDKRWRSSFMFYLTFVSASPPFIDWLRENIKKLSRTDGHISSSKGRNLCQLRYAKKEALVVMRKMYEKKQCICLRRKRLKIERTLRIVGESLSAE